MNKLVSNTACAGSVFIIFCIVIFLKISNYLYADITQETIKIQKYMTYENKLSLNLTIHAYKLKIQLEKNNTKPVILNLHKFQQVTPDTTIIVVQVQKNILKLQFLVASLAQVQNINTVLIIFSHSYYDNNINQLIRSIDFCKVMQIFYPHSLQLNPHRFPGFDPDDCNSGSSNSRFAHNCFMRNAHLTEHKQHWWWKANYVFDYFPLSRKLESPIIFLEEDNYVAPDLLYIFQYAKRSLLYFPKVQLISLGRQFSKNLDTSLLIIEPWTAEHSVGIAFNKTLWRKILRLSAEYCMYNDHNWPYSMLNLFHSFPRGFINVISSMSPRVLSTRQYQNKNDIEKASRQLRNLFPEKVRAVFLFGPNGWVEQVPKLPPVGSGDWHDLRDQLLCFDPLMSTTTEEIRYEDVYATLIR